MSQKEIKQQLANLSAGSIIEFYSIDTTQLEENYLQTSPINEQILNLTSSSGFGLNYISIGGVRYICVPCEFSDVGRSIDGSQTKRPTFAISNLNGYGSYVLRNTKNLAGARLYRKRIFVENIDAESFLQVPFWNTPSSSRLISEDSWYVNSVASETAAKIDLNLVSPVDFDEVRLPKRKMFSNTCDFEYRNSMGCAFGLGFGDGKPKTDDKNQPLSVYGITSLVDRGEWAVGVSYNLGDFVYLKKREKLNEFNNDYKKFFYTCKSAHVSSVQTKPYIGRNNWIPDLCSKTVKACSQRFSGSALRFGGFPGIISKRYS